MVHILSGSSSLRRMVDTSAFAMSISTSCSGVGARRQMSTTASTRPFLKRATRQSMSESTLVDHGERLHDGIIPGGELGEEEDGDLQHLGADRVEVDLDEAVDDGGPGERGEDGLLGAGLLPEALDLEHQLLGLGQLLERAEA